MAIEENTGIPRSIWLSGTPVREGNRFPCGVGPVIIPVKSVSTNPNKMLGIKILWIQGTARQQYGIEQSTLHAQRLWTSFSAIETTDEGEG